MPRAIAVSTGCRRARPTAISWARRIWGPVEGARVQLKFASYNVHKALGLDGRRDPERILAVLRELRADVIALPEVDRRYGERASARAEERRVGKGGCRKG